MKPFECQGYWWLPETQEKCAGTLRCDAAGELNLHLFGAIVDRDDAFKHSSRVPAVYGEIVDLSGVERTAPPGNLVTLLHCFVSGEIRGSSRSQTLFAHRAIFGDMHVPPDGGRFRRANLQYSGLANWSDAISGIDRRPAADPKGLWATWTAGAEPAQVPFPGGRLSLSASANMSSRARERVLTENMWLSLSYDIAVDERTLEKDAYAIQNLLTFIADKPSAITQFEVGEGVERQLRDLRVVGPAVFDDEEVANRVRPHEMLFGYSNVAERFGDFVRRWFELTERQASSLLVYFGLKYAAPRYADLRFQLMAQAVSLYQMVGFEPVAAPMTRLMPSEQLAPQTRDELVRSHPLVSLEAALRALADEHNLVIEPLIQGTTIQGREAFIARMINAMRRVLYRYGVDSTDDLPFYWYTEVLGFFWKAAVLKDLGFSDTEQQKLFSRNRLYQHVANIISHEIFK